MFTYYALFLICVSHQLKADHNEFSQLQLINTQYNIQQYPLLSYPKECYDILEIFAQYASNLTLCTILNTRPITLCEKCVSLYVDFRDNYKKLLDSVINGTSCRSVFISQDRLNAVQLYYDNILNVWNMGNCNGCFDWTQGKPSLKNDTIHFHKMYNDTNKCIDKTDKNEVCITCMQSYEQLDEFYKTLSSDSIGVDSVCMDIVDSMNFTRSKWSKTLNCCNLRRTPEIVFLSCAVVISFLPVLFYVAVRFCGPIRDLPNVLKQSRFKQTILRGLSIDSRSD